MSDVFSPGNLLLLLIEYDISQSYSIILVAIIGIILFLAIHVLLVLWLLPMGISIPLVLPFIYVPAIIGFITVFAAYPVIDKYLIAPYKNEDIDDSDEQQEEPISE